jgi:hypothetical protein
LGLAITIETTIVTTALQWSVCRHWDDTAAALLKVPLIDLAVPARVEFNLWKL